MSISIILGILFISVSTALLFGRHYRYIFILAVVYKTMSYWVISLWQHISEPFSSIIMYRIGDIDYFPLISAFSRFSFGETMLYELRGSGLLSFPFGGIFIHGLFYRFFNQFGFVLADLFIAVTYYIILCTLLRLLGISLFWSRAAGLLVVSGAASPIFGRLFSYLPFENATGSYLYFWTWRIPRPFVSEIFVLLCFYFILKILYVQNPLANKKNYFFLGMAAALLLQSAFYPSVVMGICIFSFVLYMVIRYRNSIYEAVKSIAVFFITISICVLPFIAQRLKENPDITRRFGIFSLSRGNLYFLSNMRFILALLFVFAYALVLLLLIRRYCDAEDKNRRVKGITCLFVLCCAAYIAMPALIMVFGKGVQLYQFRSIFFRMLSISFLVMSLYALDIMRLIFEKSMGRFKRKPFLIDILKKATTAFVIFCSIFYATKTAYALSQNNSHMRSNFPEWALLTDYRTDFIELIRELSKDKYRDCKVIGTFDWQVCSWWMTFRHGYSCVANPFLTTATDAEIESRLIHFCKFLGMKAADFTSFLKRRYVNIFWLGHEKYEADKAYTFAPISDYDIGDQEAIMQTTIFGFWHLAIPISEQKRLMNQYKQAAVKDNMPRLDFIVLTNDESVRNLAPPRDEFILSYKNKTFRLWHRK